MEEIIEKLEKEEEHYAEWLKRNRNAQVIAPRVQQDWEIVRWEIDALKARPEEAAEIPFPASADDYDRRYDSLKAALPMLPAFVIEASESASAGTSAGSMGTYMFVAQAGDLGTPQAQQYSEKYALRYWQMQEEQARPATVRSLLQRLGNPQTTERFDRALSAYNATKIGTGERAAAAVEMRTLLDGIRGDLFQIARKKPRENMTWNKMSDRLAKGGAEAKDIVDQGRERSRLHSELSMILKDREGDSLMNLHHVWAQMLDHIYVVLNLVDLQSKGKFVDS